MLWYEIAAFSLLVGLAWADEVLDLPTQLIGEPRSGIREAWIETIVIVLVAIPAVVLTGRVVARLSSNIAERKHADEALRESEQRLRAVFEGALDGIAIFDEERRFVEVNPAACTIFGRAQEDLVGRYTSEVTAPGNDMSEAVHAFRRDGNGHGGWRIIRPDGSLRDLEYSARAGFRPGRDLSVFRDVTERKRANEILRESEQRFRAVFEGALDAMVILDDEGVYVDANPAACTLYGRSQKDLVGRRVGEASAQGLDAQEAFRAIRHSGQRKEDWRIARTDGTVSDVEYAARAGILPGRHLVVLRDVTERKRLEEKLRRSEAYLAEGQRLSHTGSWAWNIVTGELFWSSETFRITGLDPATTAPSHELFLARLHAADRERVERELASAQREKRDFKSRFRMLGPEGSVRHLESLGKPVRNEAGEILEYVGVVADVTERHQGEERLHQTTAQLRALSKRLQLAREEERAEVARNVHDEVGQALTALRMDVAWLERRVASGEDRSSLESKLQKMSALIDTTLGAVQRIATDLRPGVLDVLGLEAAIEWYVSEFEQRTGIACRFHSEVLEAPVDATRSTAVFRILQEALTNVARHSVATQTRIHLSSDREQVRLEIRDNGRGVAEDRIENSASLGLIGMRERARALGGDVEVSGIAGHGTTVLVTIPL